MEDNVEIVEYEDAIVIYRGDINPKLFIQSLREILENRSINLPSQRNS